MWNMKNEMNRLQWLDIAKGIGIILMVLGHSSMPQMIQNWIFAFHMPLFFLTSGVATNWSKDFWVIFLKRKCIGLLLPFLVYSLLNIFLMRIADIGHFDITTGWGDYALWFVPVLFFASLLVKTTFCIGDKFAKIAAFVALAMAGTSLVLCVNKIIFPWNLSTVPYATFYLIAGAYIRPYLKRLVSLKMFWIFICLIITLVISSFWHLDMARNQCVPIVPLTIGAFSGTACVALLSIRIERIGGQISRLLQAIGRETFIILAFSQIIIVILNKYLSMDFVLKYIFLASILLAIKYMKDSVKRCYYRLMK